MLRSRSFLLILSILLICFFANSTFSQNSGLTSEQILQKMGQQYANAKSYQDVGVVQLISKANELKIDKAVSFKTYFLRPNKLRFEWEVHRSPNKYWSILWSDGDNTFIYGDLNELERKDDLHMGIASATGVSLGSAFEIPNLLLKEIGGFRLTEMSQISLLREEQFEGENCFVIRGYAPLNDQLDLWISKNDFLLRKIRSQSSDQYYSEDIRRDIKLNEPISNEFFQYTPPPKKDSKIVYCLPIIILTLSVVFLISVKNKV